MKWAKHTHLIIELLLVSFDGHFCIYPVTCQWRCLINFPRFEFGDYRKPLPQDRGIEKEVIKWWQVGVTLTVQHRLVCASRGGNTVIIILHHQQGGFLTMTTKAKTSALQTPPPSSVSRVGKLATEQHLITWSTNYHNLRYLSEQGKVKRGNVWILY